MPRGRLGVLVAAALLVVFGVWRVRLGSDVGDGTHVVVLAMRMAQGDQVLTDEMNLQAFGSLAAVPFTWAWLQVFGVEGIVLASRVFYLALALAVGALAYRALRVGLGRAAAFTATVLMLLPTPYNLLVTSYNTMPVLMLGLAVCAGFAALSARSRGWGLVAGVALALAVLSHPLSVVPAALLALTLLVLARGAPAARGLLLGGGVASVLVVLAIAIGPGPGALLETISYTADYQASRPQPWQRALRTLGTITGGLTGAPFLAGAVLALVGLLPWAPSRCRCWAVLAAAPVAVAVLWVLGRGDEVPGELLGLYSPVLGLLLVLLLVIPVAAWTHRAGDRQVRLLLVLSTPVALLGVLAFAMSTSASVRWGAPLAPALPLLGALGAGLVRWCGSEARPDRRGATALLAASVLVGSVVAHHPLRSFRDGSPEQLVGPVAGGPLAGLHTRPDGLEGDCMRRGLAADWVRERESVFFHGVPGGYAYTGARMDTNLVWVANFGAPNERTVRWWTETGRFPDVAFVGGAAVTAAGSWEELAREDPIIAHLLDHYEIVAVGSTPIEQDYVLRREVPSWAPEQPSVPAGCEGVVTGDGPAAGR